VIAGNIAGAASLAASADPAVQKQAVRDGVVDFLVTSLDEALRILKNEIRKRETVAVCVAVDPPAIEREMLARGVAPDLLRPAVASVDTADSGRKRKHIEADFAQSLACLTWTVASAPARWLPKLDAIAVECLDSNASASLRWLRLAPRYLGRLANDWRSLRCDREFAAAFIVQVRERVARGKIGVPVEIHSNYLGTGEEYHFSPPESPVRAS
jgi:urocanate hydratase